MKQHQIEVDPYTLEKYKLSAARIAEALAIAVGVLPFTLGSLRAALLTALTIPLSLLSAFACMRFQGIPANLLSIGALVTVEHIVRRLDERQSLNPPRSVFETVRQASLEAERPIFFALLIIIAAYFPLFTLERVERRLFTPMAYTVCFALVGALLLTMTLAPRLRPTSSSAAPDTGRIRCPAGSSPARSGSLAVPSAGRGWWWRSASRRWPERACFPPASAPSFCRNWTKASSGSALISRREFRWQNRPRPLRRCGR